MAKQEKPKINRYRYFPNKDVNKLRFLHFHKKASAIVSRTFSNLNHTETLLLTSILDQSLLKGVRQVGRKDTLSSISGNYQYKITLSFVWDALVRKGYLTEFQANDFLFYRLSYSGKQVIEIYLKGHEETIKKHTPKYKKPITIAEYFSD